MGFISCLNENFWWVGMITEIDKESREIKVNFMHPNGSSTSFFWPSREDKWWFPMEHVICTLAHHIQSLEGCILLQRKIQRNYQHFLENNNFM